MVETGENASRARDQGRNNFQFEVPRLEDGDDDDGLPGCRQYLHNNNVYLVSKIHLFQPVFSSIFCRLSDLVPDPTLRTPLTLGKQP